MEIRIRRGRDDEPTAYTEFRVTAPVFVVQRGAEDFWYIFRLEQGAGVQTLGAYRCRDAAELDAKQAMIANLTVAVVDLDKSL